MSTSAKAAKSETDIRTSRLFVIRALCALGDPVGHELHVGIAPEGRTVLWHARAVRVEAAKFLNKPRLVGFARHDDALAGRAAALAQRAEGGKIDPAEIEALVVRLGRVVAILAAFACGIVRGAVHERADVAAEADTGWTRV